MELQLFSSEPIYDDLEQTKLEHSLTFMAGKLGFENPLTQKILKGKSPRERAAELIAGTKVKEVADRKKLYEQDPAAFAKSSDPMIQLVLLVDDPARAVRKTIEAEDEIKRQAYGQIAQATFKVQGATTYPDATFTLRLAFGQAKGYEEEGKQIPFETDFAGLYERSAQHDNQPPFNLPKSWVTAKDQLDLKTPYNFVSTADIIGGNSGSPVLNKNAEFVGIIFDGNIYSLVLDFIYTDQKARAVSVHSKSITEALAKVYHADDLVKEIFRNSPSAK
jgi:hypothetical protein